MERASEHLKLFKADFLDYESLCFAISGCSGVFHVASPVPFPTAITDPEAQLLEPAVKPCLEAKVKRVVVVSSIAAVVMSPNCPTDQVKHERCWSDPEYVRSTKNWYHLRKHVQTEAAVLEFERSSGLEL